MESRDAFDCSPVPTITTKPLLQPALSEPDCAPPTAAEFTAGGPFEPADGPLFCVSESSSPCAAELWGLLDWDPFHFDWPHW